MIVNRDQAISGESGLLHRIDKSISYRHVFKGQLPAICFTSKAGFGLHDMGSRLSGLFHLTGLAIGIGQSPQQGKYEGYSSG